MKSLYMTFGGTFLSLSVSEARFVLDHINGHTPCIIKNHNELLEEEKESTPKQEEEVSIAKLKPFESHNLAINPKPSVLQIPSREEEIIPLGIHFDDEFWEELHLPAP